jgi:hypothetical protein
MKWIKKTWGYESECGRFQIVRLIRRDGIEWQLIDRAVPVEECVSGARRTLQDAKGAAEWRQVHRRVVEQQS